MRRFQLISKQLSKIHKTQFQNPKFPNFITPTLPESQNSITSQHFNFTTIAQESNPPLASDEVKALVDEISELTLLEISDLSEVLRNKLDIQMPAMAVMMPGMTFSGIGGGGGAAAAAGAAVAGKVEEKVEKTVFDVKLDGFDAAAKIKVIKEVRGFTDLGLKEAKDLVEKAPTLLKKGVTKEEAEKIIAKMKEVGAKVSME